MEQKYTKKENANVNEKIADRASTKTIMLSKKRRKMDE